MLKSQRINLGILAHVDAGKTTLAERLLYLTGSIRRTGRVDHGDAFLDTDETEKRRGITIFSKMAQMEFEGKKITLVDTPGHADFSAEMERTLQILDYAVLLISAPDGIQGQVQTLWRLLERYQVPVFIFVNKMDQPGTQADDLMRELKENLNQGCVCLGTGSETDEETAEHTGRDAAGCTERYNGREGYTGRNAAGHTERHTGSEAAGHTGRDAAGAGRQQDRRNEEASTYGGESLRPDHSRDISAGLSEETLEEIAVRDDDLLEHYLEGEEITHRQICDLIRSRKLFPCWFGSALKGKGTLSFLQDLVSCMELPEYPDEFSARVYKVSRDSAGSRLTWLKVTGGILKAKQLLGEEKVDQIRIWSGAGSTIAAEVPAGTVCAVSGPEHTFAWQTFGTHPGNDLPLLEPVMNYRIGLPEGSDLHAAWMKLRQLEEEIPELHLQWNGQKREISVGLMGQVQTEILKEMIRKRYQLPVTFDEGSIVYKETIVSTVEGIGHYEPLRHYAEVHLLMEPGEPGSGLVFDTDCSTDSLALNWQRLILTHLEEKRHAGVLTGSEITDMKITLIAGKAHIKHTEGGDFRQAVYRAVRQGLMKAESRLLEPVYRFRLEIPDSCVGRAMTDIRRMNGSFEDPELKNGQAFLTGRVPVSCMGGYPSEVAAYSGGTGSLTCTLAGYEPCHNSEEVIAEFGYDPETDAENVSGSVFCSHGAGMFIPWYQVGEYMHLEARIPSELDGSGYRQDPESDADMSGTVNIHGAGTNPDAPGLTRKVQTGKAKSIPADIQDDAQLYEIFMRTYGSSKQERTGWKKFNRFDQAPRRSSLSDSPGGSAPRGSAPAGSESGESASAKNTPGESAPRGSAPGGSAQNKFSSESGRYHRAGRPGTDRGQEYLLVDGYNIIYAWKELSELAETNLDGARVRLMEILSNYQGFRKMTLIVVFDAYKVEGGTELVQKYHNIHVVYTREAETADAYIERTVRSFSRNARITVATSDAAEQVIIFGAGAARMSARELKDEIRLACREMAEDYLKEHPGGRNYLFENVEEELAQLLEDVRLGKRILN